MTSKLYHRVLRTSTQVLGVLLLLLLWEFNAHLGYYRYVAPTLPSEFFPTLREVGLAVAQSVTNLSYLDSLQLTIIRTLAAFVIAAILGIICALLAARSVFADNLTYYPTEFFRQLPAVAVIPFAIVIFGIYTPMKIAVAVFGCFFPIFVATREGLKNVEPGLMITARAYKWSGTRLLFGVMLPSAVPHILGALRITLAISLILVVMSEMLVGGDGLGMRIVEKERTFDFPGLYAETFLLGTIGVVLNLLLNAASRKVYYWRSDTNWRGSK